MGKVFVELNPKGNRIDVDYKYDRDLVARMRQIPGRAYVKTPHKHWTVPLDMTTCRLLRQAYGDLLVVGPELRSWAINAKRTEERLGSIALADSGTLMRLPQVLPTLAKAIHLGPKGLWMTEAEKVAALVGPGSYQAADVQFLAEATAPLNGNQQGLGKTPEWIAAIWEAGLEEGDHLIIAPSAAVDGTWEAELEKWMADATTSVGIYACTGNRSQRQATLDKWLASEAASRWVVINPQMVQYRKTNERTAIVRKARPKEIKAGTCCFCLRLKDGHHHYEPTWPELFAYQWNSIAIDECHKGNIRNHRSLTSFSIHDLELVPGGKRHALSGTPMKKKGADIWGILHWLRPDVFTSYWRFAELFFEVKSNGFGKVVGELRKDREGEFFQYLTPYVVRRTKDECLPWLPPKQYIPVVVRLAGKQAKQYAEMEEDGAARLGEERVTTTSILAEFTRLSQFANAYCLFDEHGEVAPTRESAKLEALWQKLDEAGILDGTTEEQTLIFSQSRKMVELVHTTLVEAGVATAMVKGGQTKQGQRRAIKEAFQAGDTKVLCVVTTAGGVSLTLDAADSAHFIDTSWAPDDDEQAEDRIHRATTNKQVRIYQYIAEGTIDEYRAEMAIDKAEAHKYILDVRRKILKEQNL